MVKLYLVIIRFDSMAVIMASWLAIYRRYTGTQLSSEIQKLQAQLDNPYESISSGGKTASRNLEQLATRLEAALKTQAERSRSFTDKTYADFRR